MRKRIIAGLLLLTAGCLLCGCGDGRAGLGEEEKRQLTEGTAQETVQLSPTGEKETRVAYQPSPAGAENAPLPQEPGAENAPLPQEPGAKESGEEEADAELTPAAGRMREMLQKVQPLWTRPAETGTKWGEMTLTLQLLQETLATHGVRPFQLEYELVSIDMPQGKQAQEKINKALREQYELFREKNLKLWNDGKDWWELYGNGSEGAAWGQWEDRVSTEFLAKEESDSLSFRMSEYTYLGGAHPETLMSFLNFDTQTGELLTLEDIFEDSQAGKQAAAEWIIAFIKESGMEEEVWEDYEQIVPREVVAEGRWYLADEGIGFVADVYTLACYACGPKEFLIPYDELSPYLTILS